MTVLLILESLGSTELFFILVMALVFFGPRKLPQLSRTLGKNLASFRRASEDFKRTWDREVTMEELGGPVDLDLDETPATQPIQPPTIQAIAPELVIARQSATNNPAEPKVVEPTPAPEAQPLAKRDWL